MSENTAAAAPGGSALIKGVMMSNGVRTAGAVRTPDGEIVVRIFADESSVKPSRVPLRIRKLPVLRGLFGVGGGLGQSVDALRWSASMQEENTQLFESSSVKKALMTMFTGFAAFFGLLPLWVAFKVYEKLDGGTVVFALAEAGFSLGLFLGYLALISQMGHIREVFQFHGAEHKTVAAYEAGMSLTPETVSAYSRFHPRCGTNYMALVLLGTALLAPVMVLLPLWVALPIRMVGLLLVAGLSYEVLRGAARNMESWGRFVLAPGLMIQRLTTREPTRDQIEVAIVAFQHALSAEQLVELNSRTALVAA